jgi:hypothetical protein
MASVDLCFNTKLVVEHVFTLAPSFGETRNWSPNQMFTDSCIRTVTACDILSSLWISRLCGVRNESWLIARWGAADWNASICSAAQLLRCCVSDKASQNGRHFHSRAICRLCFLFKRLASLHGAVRRVCAASASLKSGFPLAGGRSGGGPGSGGVDAGQVFRLRKQARAAGVAAARFRSSSGRGSGLGPGHGVHRFRSSIRWRTGPDAGPGSGPGIGSVRVRQAPPGERRDRDRLRRRRPLPGGGLSAGRYLLGAAPALGAGALAGLEPGRRRQPTPSHDGAASDVGAPRAPRFHTVSPRGSRSRAGRRRGRRPGRTSR